MYFFGIGVWVLALNSRFSATFYCPVLKYQHATLFKTVCMNNAVDAVTLVTTDLITAVGTIPIAVAMVVPQVIWNGGYLVCNTLYYSFGDVDEWLSRAGFKTEPVEDPVPPTSAVSENVWLGQSGLIKSEMAKISAAAGAREGARFHR